MTASPKVAGEAPGKRQKKVSIDDPNTWLQGATAVKAAFDAFRTAIGLVRDARKAIGGDDAQAQVVTKALDHAVSTAAIAEAEIAKALGYQLCKCEFPPTMMLTVGYRSRGTETGEPVFQCPKCGILSCGPWAYTRVAAPRPGGDP